MPAARNWQVKGRPRLVSFLMDENTASVPGSWATGFLADSRDPLRHHVINLTAQREKVRPRESRCCSKATKAEPILILGCLTPKAIVPGWALQKADV